MAFASVIGLEQPRAAPRVNPRVLFTVLVYTVALTLGALVISGRFAPWSPSGEVQQVHVTDGSGSGSFVLCSGCYYLPHYWDWWDCGSCKPVVVYKDGAYHKAKFYHPYKHDYYPIFWVPGYSHPVYWDHGWKKVTVHQPYYYPQYQYKPWYPHHYDPCRCDWKVYHRGQQQVVKVNVTVVVKVTVHHW